eukprot:CAMPEP_0184268618 /NCGR_PEP_ID=MMETSP0977-20130417/32867_1 /TAXON_ID=483370 /ORGANISM="non described non described, Strain CCMP2097" /LENGTH=31 /DNA_ID= /DNA_START= /DNA_END= /DNA_ORIENTATION=
MSGHFRWEAGPGRLRKCRARTARRRSARQHL